MVGLVSSLRPAHGKLVPFLTTVSLAPLELREAGWLDSLRRSVTPVDQLKPPQTPTDCGALYALLEEQAGG